MEKKLSGVEFQCSPSNLIWHGFECYMQDWTQKNTHTIISNNDSVMTVLIQYKHRKRLTIHDWSFCNYIFKKYSLLSFQLVSLGVFPDLQLFMKHVLNYGHHIKACAIFDDNSHPRRLRPILTISFLLVASLSTIPLDLWSGSTWRHRDFENLVTWVKVQGCYHQKNYLLKYPTLPRNSQKCMGAYLACCLLMHWCWSTRPSLSKLLSNYSLYWPVSYNTYSE